MKRLNIYIDESGDPGFTKGGSKLYTISFTLHETINSLEKEIKYLNDKLDMIGYKGMIHMALLVAKRGEYSNYNLEKRRNIFWTLFYFILKSTLKIKTIVIDKKYQNTRKQLNKELFKQIEDFINSNKEYFEKFEKIYIYYDNGQEQLNYILDSAFSSFSNVEKIVEFDHEEERLFQVSDMLTFIDKLYYKKKNHIPLTNAEKYFLSNEELKRIMKFLNNKRI